MNEIRYIYATIEQDSFGNMVCNGIIDTFEERVGSNYVSIDTYDEFLMLKKMWVGTEWVDNPNYILPLSE